jgi:hypothetical protein
VDQAPSCEASPTILIVSPKLVVLRTLKVTATAVWVAHEDLVVEEDVEVVLVEALPVVVGEVPPVPLGVCEAGKEVAVAVE